MTAYFMIREGVPIGYGLVAAIARKEIPELVEWMTGSAQMVYCVLNDDEFERVKAEPGAIVLSSEFNRGEIAIAFGPREEWPEDFGRFRGFFEEIEGRESPEVNFTEEAY
jgi:hypothetical protein